eukprot:6175049-Pleurochrysis_carterae.AAC.6
MSRKYWQRGSTFKFDRWRARRALHAGTFIQYMRWNLRMRQRVGTYGCGSLKRWHCNRYGLIGIPAKVYPPGVCRFRPHRADRAEVPAVLSVSEVCTREHGDPSACHALPWRACLGRAAL